MQIAPRGDAVGFVDEGGGHDGGGQRAGHAVPAESVLVLHSAGEEGSGVSSRPVSTLNLPVKIPYLLHTKIGLLVVI